MADEMVAFSRSQILEQANLAVMAQANTANQAVLKLVQGQCQRVTVMVYVPLSSISTSNSSEIETSLLC